LWVSFGIDSPAVMKLNSAMLFGRYLNTTVAQLTKPCATYSTVRTVTTASLDASDHYDKAKPFSSIPGPSGLPYIGTLLYYKAGKPFQSAHVVIWSDIITARRKRSQCVSNNSSVSIAESIESSCLV